MESQRKEWDRNTNRSILELPAMMVGCFIGWRQSHFRDYSPWLMLLGIGLTALCAFGFRVANQRQFDLGLSLIFLLTGGMSAGLAFALGMIFGIFD